MIFDSLDKLYLYEKAFPSLKTVRNILESENLLDKKEGAYTTDDENCRYNVCVYRTIEEHKDFEIHKNEADVQIMLEGMEFMTSPSRDLIKHASDYDATNDICFTSGPHIVSYMALPGYFALFLPGEPHAPGLALEKSMNAKKVVFKLKM